MTATTTPRVPQWTFGERLAKARKDSGLQQSELGEKLGISKSTVAKWETDRGRPREFMKYVQRWAEETEVPVAFLLGMEEGAPPEYAPWDSNPEPNDSWWRWPEAA